MKITDADELTSQIVQNGTGSKRIDSILTSIFACGISTHDIEILVRYLLKTGMTTTRRELGKIIAFELYKAREQWKRNHNVDETCEEPNL